jgi:hypothetical protein
VENFQAKGGFLEKIVWALTHFFEISAKLCFLYPLRIINLVFIL